MKPLELIVPPKLVRRLPGDPLFWEWRAQFMAERAARRHKRLTDAELAAEYWRYESDLRDAFLQMDKPPSRARVEAAEELNRRVETLHCFATLPHYDEVTE